MICSVNIYLILFTVKFIKRKYPPVKKNLIFFKEIPLPLFSGPVYQTWMFRFCIKHISILTFICYVNLL